MLNPRPVLTFKAWYAQLRFFTILLAECAGNPAEKARLARKLLAQARKRIG